MGHGDKTHLIYEDESWTYTEAYAETASIAAWMFDNGIKQGDRVALAFRNYPEWLLCYWALTSVGITVVGMNAWWVTDEMEYGLQDSAPKAFIGDVERLNAVLPVRDKFPDMKFIGLRLPEAIDGVIDYAELKNHGGSMPEGLTATRMLAFFTLPARRVARKALSWTTRLRLEPHECRLYGRRLQYGRGYGQRDCRRIACPRRGSVADYAGNDTAFPRDRQ